MTLLQRDLFNSPYSGVFCATNDVLTLVPPGIPKDDMEYISEALDTRVEVITIGGSRVVGTLVAMNSRGILVSNIATSREVKKLEKITTNLDFLNSPIITKYFLEFQLACLLKNVGISSNSSSCFISSSMSIFS